MCKIFKQVKVEMVTDYMDIEITDEQLENLGNWVDINDDAELLSAYLESYWSEWEDNLVLGDIEYDDELIEKVE
jgi:hypothetical protein